MMEKAIFKKARATGFWNTYARWYKQWMGHTDYHKGIINALSMLVKPGWQVLDVGAGNGILSRSLCQKGCHVTALEPATAMRSLMREATGKHQTRGIEVDCRCLEDLSANDVGHHDLVVACNSLHLTQMGFWLSLKKLFQARPKHIFVATEFVSPDIKIPVKWGDYQLVFGRVECVESSFAYHGEEEAIHHWAASNGHFPDARERQLLKSSLVSRNNHLWMKDTELVGMFCWKALIS